MNKARRIEGSSFIHKEHGAVTIYVILVIVPIFIFQAVLIDYIRIKVASMEAEQATRAAARSVLSSYDKRLVDYGLFGLKASDEERKSIANKVLNNYGTDDADSSTFQWLVLNTLDEQTNIIPTYSLADHRLLKQQILEEMKYKAPIEFTRNLYDKWKGKKEIVDQTEDDVHVAEQLDELLKQREKKLAIAFYYVDRINNHITTMTESYKLKLNAYHIDGEKDEDFALILSSLNDDFQYLQNQQDYINKEVVEAEAIEQRMLLQWNQETNEKLNDVYILGREFYLDYRISAVTPISLFGAFINQHTAYKDDHFEPDDTQAYTDSFQSWYNHRSNEENRRIEAFEKLEQQKKDQKKKIKGQMEQTKQAAAAQICTNGNAEQYKQLNTHYERYLSFNKGHNEKEFDPSYALDQSTDQYQASSFSLLTNLANVMENIRDEVYVNEYAMYYFNYRTSTLMSHRSPIEEKLNKHALLGQEVEYILYGLSSCTANRVAAYSEIYSIRFAIHLVETLLDARKAAIGFGSPLLMILVATAEAGIKAYRDMERIMNGEDVPVLAKWGQFKMNYADYLRMFLIVHSDETRKLSRIQSLIQLNSQIDMLQAPAYIELHSVVTMRLWFLRGKSYQIKKRVAMSY